MTGIMIYYGVGLIVAAIFLLFKKCGFFSTRVQITLWILASCFLGVMAWSISAPHVWFSDFYKAYYPAAMVVTGKAVYEPDLGAYALSASQSGDLFNYETRLTGLRNLMVTRNFVNLPVLAWLFAPFVLLDSFSAALVFSIFGIFLIALSWFFLHRLAKLETIHATILFFLFVVNGPLIYGIKEGNTSHIVFILLILALGRLQKGQDYLAGIILGLAAIIKLPLILYGFYFFYRKRWHVVVGGGSVFLLAGILSLVLFGSELNYLWYTECVRPFTKGILSAYNVQSIDSFFLRFYSGEKYFFDWNPQPPAYVHVLARSLVKGLIFFAFCFVSQLKGRSAFAKTSNFYQDRLGILEYCMVLNIAILVSPLSWTHYYVFLLIPWAFALGNTFSPDRRKNLYWLWVASIILVSGPPVYFFDLKSIILDLVTRVLVSREFFGGVILLVLMLRMRFKLGSEREQVKGGFVSEQKAKEKI